jgi:hypothetical protein
MVYLFTSHSKYDKQIKNFFSNAIARTDGLNGTFIEFENLQGLYAGVDISNIIGNLNTKGVILLLGENVYSSQRSPVHTHNWVNFEVGVAAGYKKLVLVFEEYGHDINFPIPYVSDYCRYNVDDESVGLIGDLLAQRILQRRRPQRQIRCAGCYATYFYWNNDVLENCPVCRRSSTTRRNRIDLRLSNV